MRFSLATGKYKRRAPDDPPEIQEPTPEEAEAERAARVREDEKAEKYKAQEIAEARAQPIRVSDYSTGEFCWPSDRTDSGGCKLGSRKRAPLFPVALSS